MQALPPLKPFNRRVRLVRSWRGLAIGATVGAAIGTGWAVLDWFNVFYAEPIGIAAVIGGGAIVGAIWGALGKISESALAQSIDRRAGLEDRLSSAQTGQGAYQDQIAEDAEARLAALRPAQLYPLRFGRWQGGAIALSVVAASIFLLGNTPLLLLEQAKQTQAELKKEGQKVQRVIKENLEDPREKQSLTEAEKRLADEMRRYQKDLERARMSKEESLQKAEELTKKADDLMKQNAQASLKSLETGQSQLEKAEQDKLNQANLGMVTPSMAKMSDAERKQALAKNKAEQKELERQLAEIEKRMAEIQKQLKNPNLSKAERDALEKERQALESQKKALDKQLKDAKDQEQAIQLSKEAQDIFKKMTEDPIYKEMQELAKQMKQNAEAAQAGKKPPMTKEERLALQKRLEELANQLKDPKAMQEYLKAMLAAMKAGGAMGRCAGLFPGPGRLPLPIPWAGAPSQDQWMGDTGMINKFDKGVAGGGKTTPTIVSGEKREGAPDQAYVEIKAPAQIGNRSSVPYIKVLPSYRRKAEAAMRHDEIPKEHEKRVKEYFKGLGQ
jgi:chemotaxis protein histidine kinase CheA